MNIRRLCIIGIPVFVLLVIVMFFALEVMTTFNDHVYVATITYKENFAIINGDQVDIYYRIFCQDDNGYCYKFENMDVSFRGKNNSADLQKVLKVGEKYRFVVVGYRLSVFSIYENIIKAEKLNKNSR